MGTQDLHQYLAIKLLITNHHDVYLFQKTKGPWPSSQYNTQCIQ